MQLYVLYGRRFMMKKNVCLKITIELKDYFQRQLKLWFLHNFSVPIVVNNYVKMSSVPRFNGKNELSGKVHRELNFEYKNFVCYFINTFF